MSAPIAKTELSFKLPESLSYHTTWDDADYEPVLPSRRQGLFARLARGVARSYAAWNARRVAVEELTGMTDRELADIGLSRADIPRVSEQEFAEEHASRGVARA
jgi:uncharacterized protein YjiS (DUF1127 family)